MTGQGRGGKTRGMEEMNGKWLVQGKIEAAAMVLMI